MKELLCVVVSVVIRSDPFLNGDRDVNIPVGVVTEGAKILDLYNCMIARDFPITARSPCLIVKIITQRYLPPFATARIDVRA